MTPRLLRFFAVIYALMAVSNFTKPLEMEAEHGFVLLGRRLDGTANLLAASVFGTFLGTYAWGLWNARHWALALGILYAGWVPLNMYLFTVRSPEEMGTNSLFGLTYMVLAMSGSLGAVAALLLHRDDLR